MDNFNYENLKKEAASLALKQLFQQYADDETALRKLKEYERKLL